MTDDAQRRGGADPRQDVRPDAPRAVTRDDQTREASTVTTSDQVVYRLNDRDPGTPVEKRGIDVPATIGGALATLGALVLLSSIVGAVVGTIGYQSDVKDSDLSVGGLIAGLVVLLLACLIGGWVAGRIARGRGGLHGLLAVCWLVVLAAVLAVVASLAGDKLDVTDEIDLPSWFSGDSLALAAILTGVLALLLMLLGGWLGGRLGARRTADASVALVETRRGVREHPGGITSKERA